MVPFALTVLEHIRLDVHEHGNDLGVGAEDVRLDASSDGMAFRHRGGLGHLQVEIDLEAVTETTDAESVESFGAQSGEDVLAEFLEHRFSRSVVHEVGAGPEEDPHPFETSQPTSTSPTTLSATAESSLRLATSTVTRATSEAAA